jgi:hypothetical protein
MRNYKGIEIRKHDARSRWTVQIGGAYNYPTFSTLRAAMDFIDRLDERGELK